MYERHGMNKTPTHKSWTSMRHRCNNPNYYKYYLHGGRGITICDRWNESFNNFLSDMGVRPEGTTLDRIDNDGNYEPTNCRWATARDQARNRSHKSSTGFAGVTKHGNKYIARYKLNYKNIYLGLFDTPEKAHRAYLEGIANHP